MAQTWRLLPVAVLLMATLLRSTALLVADEASALLSIKSGWKANASSWIVGTEPCLSWQGVTCDVTGTHVIALNLTKMGLTGDVPKEMETLTFLESLDVSNMDPSKFGNLSLNAVTGDLAPLGTLSSLQALNISFNTLNPGGGIPRVVYKLTNLTALMIDNCYFYGPLSPEIGNLQKLQLLYAGRNRMSGGLPKELGSLSNLLELTLWESAWDSPIPPELGNLANLQYLNLHDCKLWGGLPPEFGNFKNMQKLHLYNNDLTGHVPATWENMTRLTELRIYFNYLSGPLPSWIWTTQNLTNVQMYQNEFTGKYPTNLSPAVKKLTLQCNFLTGSAPQRPANFTMDDSWDVDDNCFDNQKKKLSNKCKTTTQCDPYYSSIANGACPPCPVSQKSLNATVCSCKPAGKKTNVVPIVAGVIGGVVGALIIVGVIMAILWKRKRDHAKLVDGRFDPALALELNDPNWQAPPGVQRFRLSELSSATGGFDEAHEIGVGGFGKVFVGNFKEGRTFAIKRASGLVSSNQGLAEFRNEVLLLSRLHHKNLVRLEGFCDESGLQILVYEFMRQGNLHAHLFRSKGSSKSLNWYNRLDIAVGIAQGLEYLHSFADPPVIHRDVKPSNILLDEHLTAKVADFGISRATEEFATHVSTRPAGTAGYFDPQYFIRRQLTTASDVYGYGVVLLELVTGQKAIDHDRISEFNLVEWARPRLRSGGIEAIIDPKLEENYPKEVFEDMAELALECALFNKDDRPSMKAVINILEPHLRNTEPPGSSHEYLSTWQSMETSSGAPTKGSSSSTKVTANSSISNSSGAATADVTTSLLPR